MVHIALVIVSADNRVIIVAKPDHASSPHIPDRIALSINVEA